VHSFGGDEWKSVWRDGAMRHQRGEFLFNQVPTFESEVSLAERRLGKTQLRWYRAMLETLMCYERQCFQNAPPYQRHDGPGWTQANGFYKCHFATRASAFHLKGP
jgi:hypothetical protein